METVKEHFNKIAGEYDGWKKKNWYYYQNLKSLYHGLIPNGSEVLEVGCGTGEILDYLKPNRGVGLDVSEKMIEIAKNKFQNSKTLIFEASTVENFNSPDKFDYIFLADVIEHLDDVNSTISALKKFCDSGSQVIISMINPLWEIPFMILEKLNLKMPEGPHHRISIGELRKKLGANGLSIKSEGYRVILPSYVPFLSNFLNKFFYKLPMIKNVGLIYFCVVSVDNL